MIDDATICAIATPPGNGAISILRLSGRDSYTIAAKLVRFPSGEKNVNKLPANSIHYASIVSGEKIIDEVFAFAEGEDQHDDMTMVLVKIM